MPAPMEGGDASAGVRLAPGTPLGKYRIVQYLAEGAFGLVYMGEHVDSLKPVAIKVLKPPRNETEQILAKKAAQVNRIIAHTTSDHVVKIHDTGTLELPGRSPMMYTVMDFLDGVNLRQLLKRDRRVEPALALLYVELAARGVAANGRGFTPELSERLLGQRIVGILEIVHRDLKPANLFLIRTEDGEPRIIVMDCDGARLAGAGNSGVLATLSKGDKQVSFGTIPYMSPELLKKSRLDQRSDIWALGVILHELIEGRRPHAGDGVGEVILNIVHDERIPLTVEVHSLVNEIIETCLQPEP
ncbi:MAG: serine/threonine-protein kinase, partial [Myxococcota bacterium]